MPIPTGVELYGQTVNIPSFMYPALTDGFDNIRTKAGWENFRIPSYVWDWVDETERNRCMWLPWRSMYVSRAGIDLPSDVPKSAHFVFLYVLYLWIEWWYDCSDEARPEGQAMLDGLVEDWGFPEYALQEDDLGTSSFYFIANKSVDGYDKFRGWLRHPYYDTSGGLSSTPWVLDADDVYLYNNGYSYMYVNVLDGAGNDIYFSTDIDGGVYYCYDDDYPTFVSTLIPDWDNRGESATWDIITTGSLGAYGQTYGLSATTISRLTTGFDELRAVAGWSDFAIPDVVWNYIDAHARNYILTFLEEAYYTGRPDDSKFTTDGLTRDMIFVWNYVLFIMHRWFMLREDMETATEMLSELTEDWGFPSASIADLVGSAYGDGWQLDGDLYAPGKIDNYDWSCYLWLGVQPTWRGLYSAVGTGADYSSIEMQNSSSNESYNYLSDPESEYITFPYWNSGWGFVAVWNIYEEPEDTSENILLNDLYAVLGGKAYYRSFGRMEAEVQTNESFVVGSVVEAKIGSTTLFKGVVTGVVFDVVEEVYSVRIADPVTAKGGTVEYTGGDILVALQEAIESISTSELIVEFENLMDTEESSSGSLDIQVFYPGTPVDAWQFFRAVCYAVGARLRYDRDGVYRLVAVADIPEYLLIDDEISADDSAMQEERVIDYANRVAVSVDEEWQTEATGNTEEIYNSSGGSAQVLRFGEQIILQSVTFPGGAENETTYVYDANGYQIEIEEIREDAQEAGGEKFVRTVVFSNISADGNQYDVDETITVYQWAYGYISEVYTWVETTETTRSWKVDLEGVSSVEEIEKGSRPIGNSAIRVETEDVGSLLMTVPICDSYLVAYPNLWNRKKYVSTIITNPLAGPLEGTSTTTEYSWVEVDIALDGDAPFGFCSKLGWYRLGVSDKSFTVPKLEKYSTKDTHEVHILAKAEDPNSIVYLGNVDYETSTVALSSEVGMQNVALGILEEKARIIHAVVSVSFSETLPHDIYEWRGYGWLIEAVTIDLERFSEEFEMVGLSTLDRLEGSINKEPSSWVEDVKTAINRRIAQFDNVARGRVLSQVGFRRYSVQIEGKTEPIEAKALDDTPALVGGSVLLVNPSGRTNKWTLISLSKENEILLPDTVQSNITPTSIPTPPELLSFTAEAYTTTIYKPTKLIWEFGTDVLYGMGVEIDLGDGSDVLTVLGNNDDFDLELPNDEVTFGMVDTFTPVATPFYTNITNERVYGTPVNLASAMVVSVPAITDLSVAVGSVLFASAHGVSVTTGYYLADDLMVLQVDHDDSAGFLDYVVDEESNDLGSNDHDYTWYELGSHTIKAKLKVLQIDDTWYDGAESSLVITVETNTEATDIYQIGGISYVALPVGGSFDYVGTPAEVASPSGASMASASELSSDGVFGQYMNDMELTFTLKGESSIHADSFATLYLICSRQYWPTQECGGGAFTDFGTLLNGYNDAMWRLHFYLSGGALRLWSGTYGCTFSNWYWYSGYNTSYPLYGTCPTNFEKTFKLVKRDNYLFSASSALQLYIDDAYFRNMGYGQVGWGGPFAQLTTNVPPTYHGRGWDKIAKTNYKDLSILGDVHLSVPQQLVQAYPAIVPGGACEFTWNDPR